MDIPNSPGLYGKVPTMGDFISRRLQARFVETWDAWLQEALSASREQLDSMWLDIYLTSPIWRFILSPGICGTAAWTGILMPSVDKVGRYFPLTLAVGIERQQALPGIFVSAADWFDRLEQLALSALEDGFELTEFDRKLQKEILQLPLTENEIHTGEDNRTKKEGKFAFQITMEKPEPMTDAFIQLCTCLLTEFLPVYSLWNTSGSEHMKSSLQVYENLPPREAYYGLLVGQKQPSDSVVETGAPVVLAATDCQAPVEARSQNINLRGPRIQWRSSARSTVGKRRKINEDAFLERPEIGLWAVADGMGGHRAGDVASSAVVDALGTLMASGNLETLTAGAEECLHKVNADLLTLADTLGPGQIIGTTVVVMLAAGERCASIWAGDSRLYRYRDGDLSQLTHDHSLVAEVSRQGAFATDEVADAVSENIVTRALGAEPQLRIDTITFEAKEGDIYLLCSDGLIREMNPEEISNILDRGGCQESSQRLIDLALERGARDNVTVVVVHAGQAELSQNSRPGP